MSRNFASLLEAVARRVPDKPALVWDDGVLTHTEIHREARRFAGFLATSKIDPGARVAVSMPNRAAFAVVLLGAFRAGVTVAPLDQRLTPEERAAILSDLRPAALIEEVAAASSDWAGAVAPPADPALILYTSGSTGRPKGAMLSHGALGFANDSWAGPVMALTPDDVVLAPLPLAHSFGLNGALLAPLLAGATVALLERFDAEAALAAIQRHRVTVLPGVATMFRRLLDSPALARYDLGSLRLAVSGAAPCPWALAQEWQRRIGTRLLRGYGSTELFRPISYLAADAGELAEAIGRPVPGVELRLEDPDGHRVPDGEIGELVIRTPAAMSGYWNAPEETRAVLVDGWFRTGDLARLLPGGLVQIVGRLRERILRGGDSVFPAEVEAVLLSHPAVGEAAVVGAPHAELGEEVVAFVALRGGTPPVGQEELIAYCRERLASFKYPRRITILDRLPKSAAGKVLKSRLVVD